MIMDPGIGGRETFERIRAIHPTMKAVNVRSSGGMSRTSTQSLGARS